MCPNPGRCPPRNADGTDLAQNAPAPPTGPPPPTPAYAVLALLVPGELSSRELVVRYHERFGDVWPRTAALVYEQARRLVRLELMAMRGSGPGRVCAITDDGRQAMSAWHATTPAAPSID